ncbi:uncharacterized protein C8Q71DRAFT_765005 [Rhodofomes roseus]|uniref:Transmembrane protein n=1 Tax=Rhodofomes roseus TaxID=34475 RepID=A0ABQ8KCF5_9APHY|nr:uncharacterized protein C8Q71DRAFT_765005 [Rhodofomes roseus]KAH9835284.1 hypothetical protein C8Q71DRAFT_765005 [Rhodofomes roseus]
MSARSSTSTAFLIPATFSTWSAAQERDLESQSLRNHVRLPTPPAALTHTARARSSLEEGSNPIDDFFGVTSPSFIPRGTQDSRHDAVGLPVHFDDAPPPYSSSEPPAYSRYGEHPTLAMYLFKFGFLFPLFWIAGSLILISPLRAPEDWELTKTEAEREQLIQSMRRTELKWAKRCLIAFSALALLISAIVAIAVLVMRT